MFFVIGNRRILTIFYGVASLLILFGTGFLGFFMLQWDISMTDEFSFHDKGSLGANPVFVLFILVGSVDQEK